MKEEQQRIAIAEACPNLFDIHETYASELSDGKLRKYMTYKGEGVSGDEIDPLSDLNAMHEAEKVLMPAQRRDYASCLHPRSTFNHMDADFEVAHATAAQRAEAFLKTLNLWQE